MGRKSDTYPVPGAPTSATYSTSAKAFRIPVRISLLSTTFGTADGASRRSLNSGDKNAGFTADVLGSLEAVIVRSSVAVLILTTRLKILNVRTMIMMVCVNSLDAVYSHTISKIAVHGGCTVLCDIAVI